MKYRSEWGGEYEVEALRAKYSNNGNLAIVLRCENGEPFSTLTVNLSDYPKLKPNMAFVDTNNNLTAEEFIKEYELGKPTGTIGFSGYCVYPLYEFDLDKIKEAK